MEIISRETELEVGVFLEDILKMRTLRSNISHSVWQWPIQVITKFPMILSAFFYVFCLIGRDTNASQFYVPIIRTKWLDDKHVVFGQVEKGHKVIKAMNDVRVNRYNRPLGRVWVSNTWTEKVEVEHEEL